MATILGEINDRVFNCIAEFLFEAIEEIGIEEREATPREAKEVVHKLVEDMILWIVVNLKSPFQACEGIPQMAEPSVSEVLGF